MAHAPYPSNLIDFIYGNDPTDVKGFGIEDLLSFNGFVKFFGGHLWTYDTVDNNFTGQSFDNDFSRALLAMHSFDRNTININYDFRVFKKDTINTHLPMRNEYFIYKMVTRHGYRMYKPTGVTNNEVFE
jgi:hypothetical protein